MPIILNGSSGIILPGGGDVVETTKTQTLQNKTIEGGGIQLRTAQSGGTAFDYTGIPAWVTRLTLVMFNLSLNGASNPIVRLGTSGGLVTSGYLSGASSVPNGISPLGLNTAAGFLIYLNGAVNIITGIMTINKLSENNWVSSYTGVYDNSPTTTSLGAGRISLPGPLTQLRVGTVGGTEIF